MIDVAALGELLIDCATKSTEASGGIPSIPSRQTVLARLEG